MNISTDNIPLQIANRSPVTQAVTGDKLASVNLTAHFNRNSVANVAASLTSNVTADIQPAEPAQVNVLVGESVENPTYERPTNKQVNDVSSASLNPAGNEQASESPDVQQQAGMEQADNKVAQEKSKQSISQKSIQEQYSDLELKQISSLKIRDSEVEAHERAHAAVGGQYAGSPTYSYQTGPDGVKYAVGGEVSIDTSSVPNDPQATLQKAQQIKAAALAPAEPSGQDRRVAAKALQMAAQARNDILQENRGNSDTKITASNSNTRSESSVPDHFSGMQGLAKESDFSQKLQNRIQQINRLYQNSSMTEATSTFQIQI